MSQDTCYQITKKQQTTTNQAETWHLILTQTRGWIQPGTLGEENVSVALSLACRESMRVKTIPVRKTHLEGQAGLGGSSSGQG